MPPAVSVVLPVHNGARFVKEALESIRRQSFEDFEIIVVDDGSTDATAGLLREFAGREARCRILTQENRGLVASLNRGVTEARGALIARMDADDVSEEGRLARQVAYLKANPEVAALGTFLSIIDAAGRVQGTRSYEHGQAKVTLAIRGHCALAHPSVIMRRGAFMDAGGYREAFRHAEDYDLWLRLGERHALDNLPETLLRYRQHEGSVSHVHRTSQLLATFMARLCAQARRRGEPEPVPDMSRPISEAVLQAPGVTPEDKAAFILEATSTLLRNPGRETDEAWLMDKMESGWAMRKYLDGQRFVRRALVPYAKICHARGQGALARQWLGRAFQLAPADAAWGLFRG